MHTTPADLTTRPRLGEGRSSRAARCAVVHYLDVGGVPAPEAAGPESLLRGMRQRLEDDDFLAGALPVFDSLYSAFSDGDP